MFQRTKICSGLLLAFGSSLLAVAPGAFAQDSVQRVEITGSSIKQIDAETSEPVTVIKVDDLKKQGVTTVEQILQQVSAVQISVGTSQVVGSGSGGASFADLRGIGANKTLVLLNGRRIANNAFDSSAPDLNMIPFAAIERVEVLRDGASSLYGTDAIGGVINFITRKDYTGGTITVGMDAPQHPGGSSHSANMGFGLGDLQKDGMNIFGFVDFNKTQAIQSDQRDFGRRVRIGNSFTTFPGTYTAKTNVPILDPDTGAILGYQNVSYTAGAAPECAASQHLIGYSDTQCLETTTDFVNYTPATQRVSGVLKGSVKLGENHTLGLEAFYSQNRTDSRIAPVPYGGLQIAPTSPYYPGNGITPIPDGVTLLPDQGNIGLRYRDVINGYREDIATDNQYRLLASLEGTVANWDYNVAATLNKNSVQDYLAHGYTNADILAPGGVIDDRINPFGAQTPEGLAVLNSAVKNGVLQSATGVVQAIDGHASREIGDWFKAGRAAAVAVGFEVRHERFVQAANTEYATQVVASTGIDPATYNAGHRNIYAGFVELNVPVLSTLDVTLAARYDKYSDFGDTTNPKVSFRFQPVKQFLLRGSYSTGFRAPSLYELNAAPSYTNTGSGLNDPVNCPGGVQTPAQAAAHPFACSNQFQALTGGNTDLKPEKSKSATLGIVLEPITDVNLEFDLWDVRFKDTIGTLDFPTLFGDYDKYGAQFHYNSTGDLSTDGSACVPGGDCGYVDARNQNLGKVHSNGVDIAAGYRMNAGAVGRFSFGLQSTWVHKYEYQNEPGGEYIQNVGVYAGAGPIFRWQHNANIAWNLDPFAIGVAAHYKTGYQDEYLGSDIDPSVDGHTKVSPYATFDLYGTWAMQKGISLTVGVKNLTDREPPYSTQQDLFQINYDPRFTDPTGRTYYARATYSF